MSYRDRFPSEPPLSGGTWDRLSQVAVKGAEYDSRERQPHPKCLEGTRVNLLGYIHGLLDDPVKNRLIWLHGTAGVGKSAVAFNVAQRMRCLKVNGLVNNEKRLAGSFFFSRKHTKRSTTGYFFATLAYQLASNFPSIREDVSRAIHENPALLDPDKSLYDQMETLFLQPLRTLRFRLRECQPPVFVVDAVDECMSKTELADLISLLGQALREHDLPVVHILLTSRSEAHIRKAMQKEEMRPVLWEIPVKTSGMGLATTISLEGADVDSDIYIFLKHSFGELQSRHTDFPQPSKDQLARLASRAGRRFIVASTMMNFIDDGDNDPRDRLQLMLDLTSEMLPGTEVYKLYDGILSTCADPKRAYMHLSVVAALADPLPISQISKLLGPGLGRDVEITLVQLRSVMDIPTDRSLPVNIYHSSVRDYASDPSNCSLPEVKCDPPHSILAICSLRLMMQDSPKHTTLLDALSELNRHSQAMQPHDPKDLKHSLSFIVQPPEPVQVLIGLLWLHGGCRSDLQAWLETLDGCAWLQTQGGKDWLQKQEGEDWLQTQGGKHWLQTEGGDDWLQTEGGGAWLQTWEGEAWLHSVNGRGWLQNRRTPDKREQLDIPSEQQWLQTTGVQQQVPDTQECQWLETQSGRDWQESQREHTWLETQIGWQEWLETGQEWQEVQSEDKWFQSQSEQEEIPSRQEWLEIQSGQDELDILGGQEWLETPGGKSWLNSHSGHKWLETQSAHEWLETQGGLVWKWSRGGDKWLQTRSAHKWLGTQSGNMWLQNQSGQEWLQSHSGHVWLQIPGGREWLETHNGREWLETHRGQWLRTHSGETWLDTQHGREWVQSQSGKEWLETPGGKSWLNSYSGHKWLETQSAHEWLETQGGLVWKRSQGGDKWLQTRSAHKWLGTQSGNIWLQNQSGQKWLQSRSGHVWLQTPGGREWLETRSGREWLETHRGWWLRTHGGETWLDTQHGREWVQSQSGHKWLEIQSGQAWLDSRGGHKWLETQSAHEWLETLSGHEWLETLSGHEWLQSQSGKEWLQIQSGKKWLETKHGREWLSQHGRGWLETQSGQEWLETQSGQEWLETQSGRGWLETHHAREWLGTQSGQEWLETLSGREWLESQNGRQWLESQSGRDWLESGRKWLQNWLESPRGRDWLESGDKWLQTLSGRNWLESPSGREWLQTLSGQDWLETSDGQAWQSTPAASAWVTMEQFSSTLETISQYIIVPGLLLLPAFQAIQLFRSLPDFLMFPAFLALSLGGRNHSIHAPPQGHSPLDIETVETMGSLNFCQTLLSSDYQDCPITVALLQPRFPPDMEIIHAIKAYTRFANEAHQRSQSACDAVKYACQNWIVHLSRTPNPWDERLDRMFRSFWNRYLLSWLEMQWCLKDLRSCLAILSEGEKLVKEHAVEATRSPQSGF